MEEDSLPRPAAAEQADEAAHDPDATSEDSAVDAMSMSSFPASDPPAVWSWEPREPADAN